MEPLDDTAAQSKPAEAVEVQRARTTRAMEAARQDIIFSLLRREKVEKITGLFQDL